jgi:hypothetical protein
MIRYFVFVSTILSREEENFAASGSKFLDWHDYYLECGKKKKIGN